VYTERYSVSMRRYSFMRKGNLSGTVLLRLDAYGG